MLFAGLGVAMAANEHNSHSGSQGPSSRPGRPPKRSLGVAMQDSSRLLPHSVHGLLSPSLLSPTGMKPETRKLIENSSIPFCMFVGIQSQKPFVCEDLCLTAAAMAEAMKLQKMKLMAMNNIHGAGSQNGTESENEELNSSAGLDLPFMMMPHPLLPVSLPPASVAMAMNQMNHLNTIANMAAAAQMHSPLSRAGASVIKECVQDSPSPAPSLEETPRPGSQPSSHPSSSVSSSPNPHTQSPERLVLNPTDGELPERDTGINMKKILKEKDEAQLALPMQKPGFEKLPLGTQTLPPGFPAPFLFADGLSSVETLLTNIQGLLKVAVDNARVQEKQVQQERKELKMELYREREMRESLERQLTSELHSRATIQKRLKKEKKAKRKLQEALEFESKRREQVEQALKQATSPESLRMSLNEAVIPEVKSEHNGNQQENSAVQDYSAFLPCHAETDRPQRRQGRNGLFDRWMQKALKKYFVNMDEYLASIGLYRKMMARDASCLFRAVSEQLYYSQNYHQRIRKECVNFIKANRCNFEPFVQGSFEKYLERLEDPQAAEGSGKLALPYKVLKALEPELYRNVEFDVWQDSRKELQKTDYMVFAGRQYFLGDKCQVRLDPKGKYYNAFIQEVGTQTTAVTVFIEELGEKHLVPLTNLKPVNPVPAWNITPSRKGNSYNHPDQYPGEIVGLLLVDIRVISRAHEQIAYFWVMTVFLFKDPELRGRRRYFKKPRGKEMLMAMSFSRPQPGLPPRLQPGPGNIHPVRSPGVHGPAPPPAGLAYEHYRPHPPPRPPRGYAPPRSSARFLNRHHLIGPDIAYYSSPSKRCYQSFDNYSFRSR
ncbi:dachshund -like protein [Labeo rohita]|uniref:Dachshund-like protein n=1 Tax=Labeo rohita TaxID=84645 RepID=A0A498MFT9_LABRO|nr:dachshund -like protein [Labeo rohita]